LTEKHLYILSHNY